MIVGQPQLSTTAVPQEEYKEMLIEQMNQKKKEKEDAKKKKWDQDIKDEERVLKELQELNDKYKQEIDLSRKGTTVEANDDKKPEPASDQ